MEPEEIAVVLARASELHFKIDETIDGLVDDAAHRHKNIQVIDACSSTEEVRSIVAIRDSLELLEEQLQSLQFLQQQQRAERDSRLVEIEESRRIFLQRLKDHTGRELEILKEAVTFAGGTVADKDHVPSVPYPYGNNDEPYFSTPKRVISVLQIQDAVEDQGSVAAFNSELDRIQNEDEESEGDLDLNLGFKRDATRLISAAMNASRELKKSLAASSVVNAFKNSLFFLGQLPGKFTGQVSGPTVKATVIMVSTLAFLSLTGLGERRKTILKVSRKHFRQCPHKSHHGFDKCRQVHRGKSYNHSSNLRKLDMSHLEHFEKSSIKNKAVRSDNSFPKCVVKERLEIPFYKEVQTPDVLYGQG